MVIEVEVTDTDIRLGIRGSVDRCPIALAINRIYPMEGGRLRGWSICSNRRPAGRAIAR